MKLRICKTHLNARVRETESKQWREIVRRCIEAEARVEWALSILQTGDLPEGVEK